MISFLFKNVFLLLESNKKKVVMTCLQCLLALLSYLYKKNSKNQFQCNIKFASAFYLYFLVRLVGLNNSLCAHIKLLLHLRKGRWLFQIQHNFIHTHFIFLLYIVHLSLCDDSIFIFISRSISLCVQKNISMSFICRLNEF